MDRAIIKLELFLATAQNTLFYPVTKYCSYAQSSLLQAKIKMNRILQICHSSLFVSGKFKDGIDDRHVLHKAKVCVLGPPPFGWILVGIHKEVGSPRVARYQKKTYNVRETQL